MIVAGIGCRRYASANVIDELLSAALALHGIDENALVAIVTEAGKVQEPGLRMVARRRGVELRGIATEELAAVADRVHTKSDRVLAARGVPSVAEAAALVAAGPGGRLLGARIANPQATCAIASGGARRNDDKPAGEQQDAGPRRARGSKERP